LFDRGHVPLMMQSALMTLGKSYKTPDKTYNPLANSKK